MDVTLTTANLTAFHLFSSAILNSTNSANVIHSASSIKNVLICESCTSGFHCPCSACRYNRNGNDPIIINMVAITSTAGRCV